MIPSGLYVKREGDYVDVVEATTEEVKSYLDKMSRRQLEEMVYTLVKKLGDSPNRTSEGLLVLTLSTRMTPSTRMVIGFGHMLPQ